MDSTRAVFFLASFALLTLACADQSDDLVVEGVLAAPVEASTTEGKHLAGYQGWFACPGDGSEIDNWVHWSPAVEPGPEAVNFDAWPETADMPADSLCHTNFELPDGSAAPLFSSYKASTVDRHFEWMAQFGLHGVLLQRFSNSLHLPRHRAFKDQVLRNTIAAAQEHGRVFAVVYDISGTDPSLWVDRLIEDWTYLVDELGLLDSDRYLHENDRPLVGIWGMGFTDRPGTPDEAHQVLDFFQNNPEPRYRATVLGGVPTYWRTRTNDAKTDPAWGGVYERLDVLSPWTVGRYRNDADADHFKTHLMAPDIAWTRPRGITYMPVIFPGFSWANLTGDAGTFNLIPRRGGRFYWRQLYNAVDLGATTVMTAMFDEVDEATALLPVAANASRVPSSGRFLHLGQDGEVLPANWYLRLAGAASEVVGGSRPNLPWIPIDPSDDGEPPPDDTPPEEPPTGSSLTPELADHYVGLAYQGILGREADPGGLAAYSSGLQAGESVLELCESLNSSEEFTSRRAQLASTDMARELYLGILGREPDSEGLAATAAAIEAGKLADRSAAMILSDEAALGF